MGEVERLFNITRRGNMVLITVYKYGPMYYLVAEG